MYVCNHHYYFDIISHRYGYGNGAGTLSMLTGEKCTNEPPISNIPATAQAYVAPKSAPIIPANGPTKFGSREVCPRCNKGKFDNFIFVFLYLFFIVAVYMAEKMMGGGYVSNCG